MEAKLDTILRNMDVDRRNSLTPEDDPLEQVYATILYFLQNQQKVSAYLQTIWNTAERHEKNPPPIILRLRQLKKENLSS